MIIKIYSEIKLFWYSKHLQITSEFLYSNKFYPKTRSRLKDNVINFCAEQMQWYNNKYVSE